MCQIVKLLINKLCLTFNPYNKLFKNRLTNTKHCNKQNISTKTIEINCLKQINNKGFSMLSFIYILPILKFIYYYSSWKKKQILKYRCTRGINASTISWTIHCINHQLNCTMTTTFSQSQRHGWTDQCINHWLNRPITTTFSHTQRTKYF